MERHAFQLHFLRSWARLCSGLAFALLLAALAVGYLRYSVRAANALARAGAKRARGASDAVARAHDLAFELSGATTRRCGDKLKPSGNTVLL